MDEKYAIFLNDNETYSNVEGCHLVTKGNDGTFTAYNLASIIDALRAAANLALRFHANGLVWDPTILRAARLDDFPKRIADTIVEYEGEG